MTVARSQGGVEERRALAMSSVAASVREFSVFLEQQVGSRAASEDIVRDAFVRAGHAAQARSERIGSWFYRSLREAVLDQPPHTAASEGKLELFRAELAPALEPGRAMREAIERHLNVMLGTVDAEQAELLRTIDLEGEEVADHARRAGASASHVAQLLSVARVELCRQVVSSFGTCNRHGFLNCTCGSSLGGYGRGALGA